MSKNVYANGNEIACKTGDGKVIAAFPDVCMSPPPPPAGPIPIPYPNSSFSKDLKKGSKTVKIGGKPIALKGQSFYKSSPLGNEAATRNFGAALLTHQISGKTEFAAGSFDVKVEGKPVCRHIDLATSNHGSAPGSTLPVPNLSTLSAATANRSAKGKECPCCFKQGCLGAFKSDDEPMSFTQYYDLGPSGNPERRAQFQKMLDDKKNKCTCDSGVFPKDPCNVFRESDSKRTEKTSKKWAKENRRYAIQFRREKGSLIKKFISKNPDRPAPKATGAFNQGNHLVPKSAGGCPDNPGNIYPDDLLCGPCKGIDDVQGEWQNAIGLERQRGLR